ncbi:MAG: anti-sigma factor [Pseudomonadota bacterium]|jgi:anti-sigma-K factor RskA|nr:anti-sigma factor [Pseudomonadota bacterium]
MRLRDPQARQLLAGEYVLGTLQGAARRRFQRWLGEDRELGDQVREWEARLVPLALRLAPVAPREIVWVELARQIGWVPQAAPTTAGAQLRANSRWLSAWATTATAAVVILAVILVAQLERPTPLPEPEIVEVPRTVASYVAALQLPDEAAQWSVSVVPESGLVRLAVAGDPRLPTQQDYELWWLADNGPVSLGVLPRSGAAEHILPAGLNITEGGKLAVSLEQAGGSPTGSPQGQVLLATPVIRAG